jgi:signal transduction histidine kinase
VRKDGVLLDVQVSTSPLRDRDGVIIGAIGMLADVTEHRRLEAQLRAAQKMEAVGLLAGGVAHDFNNLLTVISSYAELILFDEAMKGREEIAEIRGATARAAKLTRQLLAFSRRQAMEPRIINPNDVVRGVEPMVSRLFDSNIIVETSLSPDTPLIRVDPGQLEQVVMNLAINAADAMPEGGRLSIDTSGTQLRDDHAKPDTDLALGSYAVIRVRDTGHGMDDATVAQIFEPFFTTKEPGRGTGLGLSTVYGIVKQSSGTVCVDSAPGAGSLFTVYLPAVGVDSQ